MTGKGTVSRQSFKRVAPLSGLWEAPVGRPRSYCDATEGGLGAVEGIARDDRGLLSTRAWTTRLPAPSFCAAHALLSTRAWTTRRRRCRVRGL